MKLTAPWVFFVVATPLLSAAEEAAEKAAKEDVTFRALADELGRSMERLRLEKHGGPYYLEYTVKETDSFQVMASFGALSNRGRRRARDLLVDLRVGDYPLDNTNFAAGGFDFGEFYGGVGGNLTADDDYEALRHAIWLRTDAEYKQAIEVLEAKKAYLQENRVEDRPDDLSREEPLVSVEPTVRLEIDEEHWAGTVRKLSAVFRDFPRIQSSMVLFMAEGKNRWFLNNEGFKNRGGLVECGLVAMASAQAGDGMRLGDLELVAGLGEKDLPPLEELERMVRSLGERLTRLAEAPVAEEYRGPILFEGQAAAEFFAQILAPHLGRSHEPLGGRGGGRGGNQLREKIGQRILPPFITIEDDPAAKEFAGTQLLGGYWVDDDGMRAQKVTLVEKGILKTFAMSRIPTRKLKKSNGHSKGGVGAPSILFIRADGALAPEELRKELIELGKEEGLPHVLIARKINNSLSAVMNPQVMRFSMMAMGRGGVALMPPVLLYRVSVEDGKEELVRGASFGGLTLRILRDIAACGDAARAHIVAQGMNEGGHLIAPSILLKEIEVEKPPKETEKPPELVNPYFEK